MENTAPETAKNSESAAPHSQTTPQQEIFVIPREAFNYVIVAIVFMIVGTLMGFALASANDEENRRLISDAVQAAIAAGGGVAGGAPEVFAVSVDDDPSIGPADAPVTMIEFSDFRCPYCSRFETQTLNQILTNYDGRIRYVYRDMAILGDASVNAALAAECADDQGRFWDYHGLLFSNQQITTSTDGLLSLAQGAGLDMNTFTTCLNNRTHLGEIVADQSDGQRVGVRGTPAFFINGRFVSGAQPYEVFASIIDQELARAGA
ncbi:MAG: DsbA family protein [Chloroflexi bacterium]|nr:DsbA family protein [Chloroflexota bacterium]